MWLMIALLGCGGGTTDVPTAVAQSGTFEATLAVAGKLAPVEEMVIITPQFRGRPEIAFLAEHGALVDKDEKVLEFDSTQLIKSLDTARNELDLARTKIQQNQAKLSLSVNDAKAGVTRAELDLRMAQMRRTDSETVPLVEREEARIGETKSAMAIESAKAQMSSIRLDARAQAQILELEVAQKVREIETLEEQIEKAVVRSPAKGVMLVRDSWKGRWKVGDSPWTGTEIAALPDLSSMKVKAEVHEVDSPRISKGQRATVVVDAFPDRVVKGELTTAADLAVPKGDDEINVLEIEVSLDETLPEFKPGLSVRVDLVTEQVPDVVWVPLESVFPGEDDAKHVFVSGLTGWSEVAVTLGVESDTHVVVEGLDAGSVVALVDPEAEAERDAAEP